MSVPDDLTRDDVARILATLVVDAADAAEIAGFAGRTGFHYQAGRAAGGIRPVGRFGTSDVYWLPDVIALRDRVAHARAAREKPWR